MFPLSKLAMPPLNRILKLINLLNSRDCVTLEMIRKTCGVPRRTAYRYLNVISEANVPVYFDKTVGGYTLSRRSSQQFYTPTVSEALLIVLSLKSFSDRLNEEYREDIQNLVEKMIVHQPDPLEEVLPPVYAALSDIKPESETSHSVTSVLIHAAIAFKKKLRVVVIDTAGVKRTLQIKNPSLWFRENWNITEKASIGQEGTDVSQILKVSMD